MQAIVGKSVAKTGGAKIFPSAAASTKVGAAQAAPAFTYPYPHGVEIEAGSDAISRTMIAPGGGADAGVAGTGKQIGVVGGKGGTLGTKSGVIGGKTGVSVAPMGSTGAKVGSAGKVGSASGGKIGAAAATPTPTPMGPVGTKSGAKAGATGTKKTGIFDFFGNKSSTAGTQTGTAGGKATAPVASKGSTGAKIGGTGGKAGTVGPQTGIAGGKAGTVGPQTGIAGGKTGVAGKAGIAGGGKVGVAGAGSKAGAAGTQMGAAGGKAGAVVSSKGLSFGLAGFGPIIVIVGVVVAVGAYGYYRSRHPQELPDESAESDVANEDEFENVSRFRRTPVRKTKENIETMAVSAIEQLRKVMEDLGKDSSQPSSQSR